MPVNPPHYHSAENYYLTYYKLELLGTRSRTGWCFTCSLYVSRTMYIFFLEKRDYVSCASAH